MRSALKGVGWATVALPQPRETTLLHVFHVCMATWTYVASRQWLGFASVVGVVQVQLIL